MRKIEYQVMADVSGRELSAEEMRAFVPEGAKWSAESADSPIIGFPFRAVALAVRDSIRQKHPAAEVRIYAQPLIYDEEEGAFMLGDESECLGGDEGRCVLDADGIFVAK